MITTASAAFVLEQDAQAQYLGSRIFCEPTFFEALDKFAVVLRITDSATLNEIARGYMEVTATEVDAETGSGSGETDPWFNALQKAVKTKLEAIADNASVTFTVI
jgi:hypothetical protein